jgi:hypothetical protein
MLEIPAKEENHRRMKKNLISQLSKLGSLERIREKILSYFYFEQWILLIAKGVKIESVSWEHFSPLMPPSDRLWADPFVWKRGGSPLHLL